MTGPYYSERLTTDNTVEVSAKVGTRASRRIWIHEDDYPIEEGDHFRYLNGFRTQEPTDHGFRPEYGKVKEIRDSAGVEFYLISRNGRPQDVEALSIEQEK
jgi:hypothetical protein